MDTKEKKRISFRSLCPLRLGVLLISCAWLGFYFLRRGDRTLMNRLCERIVTPWHHFAGRLYDRVPFSAAEVLVVLGVLAVLAFLVQLVLHFVRRPRDGARLWAWGVSLLSIVAALFALFSLWWGVYYYSDSFCDKSGLRAEPISAEELERVTRFFVTEANEYAPRVERDNAGEYAPDISAIYERSASIYAGAEEVFPCLAEPALHAKPVRAGIVMSYLNNTGFFCPFTAEANLNSHMPAAMLPSTITHELAHQRGVAAEDEANFVAVLACMESEDADYRYSGALMAYIYLGNALYRADYAAWEKLYGELSDAVQTDLLAHNRYWERFETPVKEVSDKVYTGLLRTYGDDRGLQSYGACVDLLVAYYKNQ